MPNDKDVITKEYENRTFDENLLADGFDMKGVNDDNTMLNMMMPLQESAILEPKVETDQVASVKSMPMGGCDDEEEKKAEAKQL